MGLPYRQSLRGLRQISCRLHLPNRQNSKEAEPDTRPTALNASALQPDHPEHCLDEEPCPLGFKALWGFAPEFLEAFHRIHRTDKEPARRRVVVVACLAFQLWPHDQRCRRRSEVAAKRLNLNHNNTNGPDLTPVYSRMVIVNGPCLHGGYIAKEMVSRIVLSSSRATQIWLFPQIRGPFCGCTSSKSLAISGLCQGP